MTRASGATGRFLRDVAVNVVASLIAAGLLALGAHVATGSWILTALAGGCALVMALAMGLLFLAERSPRPFSGAAVLAVNVGAGSAAVVFAMVLVAGQWVWAPEYTSGRVVLGCLAVLFVLGGAVFLHAAFFARGPARPTT